MEKNQPRPYFPNLDGLRFFAFLIVFISHSILFLWNGKFAFAQGDLGVNFFFVLSGFLITYLLYFEKEISNGFIDIKKFYIRKILRIWPVLLIILISAFIIGNIGLKNLPFDIHLKLIDIPWFLGFISNFYIINSTVSAAVTMLWAISVEVQFYIFWPILLSYTKKKYIPSILIGIIISATTFRFIHAKELNQVLYSTFSVVSGIAIGALFGYLNFFKKDFNGNISRFFTRRNVVFLYLVLFLSLYFKIFLYHLIPSSLMNLYTALNPLIFSFLFIFIILEQNYSNHSLFKASANRKVAYLGKISYGLYAYHMLCIAIIFSTLKSIGISSGLVISLVSFGFTVLTSHLSYKYIESRIYKLKNKG